MIRVIKCMISISPIAIINYDVINSQVAVETVKIKILKLVKVMIMVKAHITR